ncbi:MAG: hypothetical protein AAF481_18280 [Acidobacteriota bacterium]
MSLRSTESPLAIRSILIGSVTWVVIIVMLVFSGFVLTLLSQNEALVRPLAGAVVGLFFASVIPFGLGMTYGVKSLSREPKLLALLGGAINGFGLLMLTVVLLAILVEG